MKSLICLVFLGMLSISLATHYVKQARPFIMDTSFLKNKHSSSKPSFAGLTALLQQSFRDTSAITEFLEGLRRRLSDERAAQAAILESSRAQCAEEETFRQGAIVEAIEAEARATSHLNLCITERDEGTSLRDLAQAAFDVYTTERTTLEQTRRQEIQLYETRRARLVDAHEAIEDTLEFLDQVEAESAGLVNQQFIQLTNRLLRVTVKTGHSHLVLPIYNKLLQMHATQNFDASVIQEVRDLITDLRDNAQAAIADLDAHEVADGERYDAEHARLDNLIDKLGRQVAVSNEYALAMQACVEQETSVIELSEDKETRNTELLAESRRLCQLTENEFTEAENARTRQLAIINAIERAAGRLTVQYEQEHAPRLEDIVQLRLL